MIPDITALMEAFTKAMNGGRDPDDLSQSILDAELLQNTESSSGDVSTADILAQTKASKVGTRTTKIVRVVRLVRLVRVAKLVKASAASDLDLDEAEVVNVSASNVGKKLTEKTTQKLVILVLVMVIVLPFLDGSLDASNFNEYQEYGFSGIHRMPQDYNGTGTISESLFRAKIEVRCAVLRKEEGRRGGDLVGPRFGFHSFSFLALSHFSLSPPNPTHPPPTLSLPLLSLFYIFLSLLDSRN